MRAYRNPGGFLREFVDRQFRAWKHEDVSYRAAFLARTKMALDKYRYEHNKLPDPGIILFANIKTYPLASYFVLLIKR